MATNTNVADAREPFVRSRDGRLRAVTIPELSWCGDVVDIRLEGKPQLFADEPAFVQKFVGGARAAVTAECPKAVAMRFHARDGDRALYRGWTSKSGGWKILQLASASGQPEPVEAIKREIAHVEASRLNALAGARHVTFVSDAEAGTAHAAWAISIVSLGLTITDASAAPLGPIGEQVEQFARRAAEACPDPRSHEFDSSANVAKHTFICGKPGEPYAWGLVAWDNGGQRFLLGLWSPDADKDNGENLKSVTAAFERIVSGDW